MVILQNATRQSIVLTLDHSSFADDEDYGFQTSNVVTVHHNGKTGALSKIVKTKSLPQSVTLHGLESEEFSDGVLECADVKNAVRAGSVRVTKSVPGEKWAQAKAVSLRPDVEPDVSAVSIPKAPAVPSDSHEGDATR